MKLKTGILLNQKQSKANYFPLRYPMKLYPLNTEQDKTELKMQNLNSLVCEEWLLRRASQ